MQFDFAESSPPAPRARLAALSGCPAKAEPLVLIANGDGAARAWIEANARSAGFAARAFQTGAELLAGFPADRAACAVLDVSLPDASGFDLQQDLARASVPIVFLTRERRIDVCVRALKAGALDFLNLPCDPAQFLESLRDAALAAASSWSQRTRSGELRARYDELTAREREIFELVSNGLLNKQIADRLSISVITVQIHRSRVMKKMRASSFASLVRMADALHLGASVRAGHAPF